MAKLAKSKIFWFAVAYACILAVALVFTLQVEHYECTLEDIKQNPNIGYHVWENAQGKEPTDEIEIFLHFEQEPSDEEMKKLEQAGFTVFDWSWTPPVGTFPTGFYTGECEVRNICRLCDLEFVVKITSPAGNMSIQ